MFCCSIGGRLHVEVEAHICCRKNTTVQCAFLIGSALCVMQDTTTNPVYTGEEAGLSLEDQRMQVRLTVVLTAVGRRWSSLQPWLAVLGSACRRRSVPEVTGAPGAPF